MAKPKFDPTQPFEAVSEPAAQAPAKPKFDPSKPFEPVSGVAPSVAAAPLPDVSQAESALAGAGQGVSFGFGDELAGAAGYLSGKAGLTPDMGYEYYRDYARNQDKEAQAANPKTFGGAQLAGGVATSVIPGLGAANSFKKAAGVGAAVGGATGAGMSEADLLSSSMAKDVLLGSAFGGAAGGAGQKLGSYLTGSKTTVDDLNRIADKLAEKATGATAVQAEKFADDAGRILRDQKLVRFGDTPSKIAERVAAAEKKSGDNIRRVIEELDSRGVTGSVENIVGKLEGEIAELSKVPGNDKLISKLQKEVNNLYLRGESRLPLSTAEQAKRNFQSQVDWKASPNKRGAMYKVSDAFRNEVESAAQAVDPALAQTFINDKKLFSVLRPIKEAAERRATQLNQSPFGGVGDAMSAAAGASGGPLGMAKAIIGRRLLAPRLSSSMSAATGAAADTLGAVGNVLGAAGEPLANASQVAIRNILLQRALENEPKRNASDILRGVNKKENK